MPHTSLINELFPAQETSLRWMRCLAQLGASMITADRSRPITMAVCLPRVEFAGVLVASGACLQAADAPPKSEWVVKCKEWANTRVAYSYKGKNSHVFWEGLLCGANGESNSCLKIQTTREGIPEHVDVHELHCVKPDPERIGQELGDQIIGKTGCIDESSKRLQKLVPRRVQREICSWWHQLVLVGVKNRLREEFCETFPCGPDKTPECTFLDMLRPAGEVRDSAVTRVISPKDITEETPPLSQGLVVLEASRRLAENLCATSHLHRIVLLGRNEPHYSDSADLINSLFMKRTSDAAITGIDCPAHIKLKMFHS